MFKNQSSFINPVDVNTRNNPIIFCPTVTTVTFHYIWGPPSHRNLQRDPRPPHSRKPKPDFFTTRQCLSKLSSFYKCPVWSNHAQSLSDTKSQWASGPASYRKCQNRCLQSCHPQWFICNYPAFGSLKASLCVFSFLCTEFLQHISGLLPCALCTLCERWNNSFLSGHA